MYIAPTCVMRGAISLSNPSHFPLIEDSKFVNPVILPPGCAKFATKPLPIGSETVVNTIGMVRVSDLSTAVAGVERAKMTSGCSSTSSLANVRMRPASPAAQRQSILTLLPSVQRDRLSPSLMALAWDCPSGSLSASTISTPIRLTRSGCCARATSGHASAAAAPPRSVMNSRRFMSDPRLRRQHLIGSTEYFDRG